MASSTRALFHDTPHGSRFYVVTEPVGDCRGSVLFIPPFAEEMNKSRRMIALTARALADTGWAVLQPDLFGCGDSPGGLSDAGWSDWLDDVSAAHAWLGARYGDQTVLWAMRSGALLLSDWLALSAIARPCVLWQPVLSGKQFVTQFFRLSVAGELLAQGEGRPGSGSARQAMERDGVVEVAGYPVGRHLIEPMERVNLVLPQSFAAPVRVLELCAPGREGLSPATGKLVERWVAQAIDAGGVAVAGAGFWQTQEIEVVPDLIAQTVAVLAECAP